MKRFERNYWRSPFPQVNWEGGFGNRDVGTQLSAQSTPLEPVSSLSRSQSITRITPPTPTEEDLAGSNPKPERSISSPTVSFSLQLPVTTTTTTVPLTSIPEESDNLTLPHPLPPAYFQSGTPVQTHIQLPLGVIYQSSGNMASMSTQVKWSYHPCVTGLRGTDEDRSRSNRFFRLIVYPVINRPSILYRTIFPNSHSPESLSLSPIFSDIAQPPELIAKTHKNISELNTLIPSHLVRTRLILSLLELFNYILFIFLIIALGVTKGHQKLLLEIAEVGIVIGIIVNAAGVNIVRTTRWKLRRQLRILSKNWSPPPVARIVRRRDNQRQFRDFWDQVGLEEGNADSTLPPEASQEHEEESTKLRWNMAFTEGDYWTSYRPIIKLELMFPPAKSHFITALRSRSEDSAHSDGREELPSYSRPAE